MSTNTTPKSSTGENPYFARIHRAPYELGRLLQELPANFSAHSPATADALQVADAAARHAENATQTILSGLEALGKLMFSAGLNEGYPVDGDQIANIGCLINHLAVEAQFLQETESNLRYALRKHGRDE